jgi:flagellar biosynthesis protein FlhF
MQIKRFEAKNMTDALRQIKRELGPEAVILSAKDLRRENRLLGISRKIGVQVTAAVDEDAPEMRRRVSSHAAPVSSRIQRSPAEPGRRPVSAASHLLHAIHDRVNLKGAAARSAAHSASGNRSKPGPSHSNADGLGNGAQSASAETPAVPDHQDALARHLSQIGLSVGTLTLDHDRANLVAVVGNPGVGKTTTLAKLAARYKCRRDETVGLLSLDAWRIGAFEQLRIYADSMSLPFAAVRRADDLPGALKHLDHCRLILVDCPAVAPGDAEQLAVLQSRLTALGNPKIVLTLSAESREEDLRYTARVYSAFQPAGVIVTKTDLTRSCSDIVNFLCRAKLPVLFYSDGPRVPFDLSPATLEQMAQGLSQKTSAMPLGPASHAERSAAAGPADCPAEAASIYLANKSSDIFHRPGCKWIRLINTANIVEFSSFAEALNHRFKPCRYCNPQHISIAGLLSKESAAQ